METIINRAAVVVLLAFGLAGCGDNAQRQVEQTVRGHLNDPDSARFSDVEVIDKGRLVCGQVNAKNAFGGYVGDRTFMIWDGTTRIASSDLESLQLSTCCISTRHAVMLRKDTAEIDGFDSACRRFGVAPFNWKRD